MEKMFTSLHRQLWHIYYCHLDPHWFGKHDIIWGDKTGGDVSSINILENNAGINIGSASVSTYNTSVSTHNTSVSIHNGSVTIYNPSANIHNTSAVIHNTNVYIHNAVVNYTMPV